MKWFSNSLGVGDCCKCPQGKGKGSDVMAMIALLLGQNEFFTCPLQQQPLWRVHRAWGPSCKAPQGSEKLKTAIVAQLVFAITIVISILDFLRLRGPWAACTWVWCSCGKHITVFVITPPLKGAETNFLAGHCDTPFGNSRLKYALLIEELNWCVR